MKLNTNRDPSAPVRERKSSACETLRITASQPVALARGMNKSDRGMQSYDSAEEFMPQAPRFQIGPTLKIPNDLEELGRKIDGLGELDRQTLRPIFDRVLESFRLRTRILNVAKEALERIRLEVAFLQFDLDVTRREKETLQRKIDGD